VALDLEGLDVQALGFLLELVLQLLDYLVGHVVHVGAPLRGADAVHEGDALKLSFRDAGNDFPSEVVAFLVGDFNDRSLLSKVEIGVIREALNRNQLLV